jgi:RNA polymerase sigma-70 factor (ECF subfamily)
MIERPTFERGIQEASDASLAVAIGRFSEPALAEVYRRHGAAVHALAARVVGSTAMADDVTQETFVNLWRRPERFDASRGSLRGFLLTLAHSRAVDALRSEAARTAREQRGGQEAFLSAGYDIERHAWDLLVADQVRVAFDDLPATERTAIEMAYFKGFSYRQVAATLGEPEGTIKSRIRSGLRRLHRALEQKGMSSPWMAT